MTAPSERPWWHGELRYGEPFILGNPLDEPDKQRFLSTEVADAEVWGEFNTHQFYIDVVDNLLIIELGGDYDYQLSCPLPDTWEEARDWLRMVTALRGGEV